MKLFILFVAFSTLWVAGPSEAAKPKYACYMHAGQGGGGIPPKPDGYPYACEFYVKKCSLLKGGKLKCDGDGGFDLGTGCVNNKTQANRVIKDLVTSKTCSCYTSPVREKNCAKKNGLGQKCMNSSKLTCNWGP